MRAFRLMRARYAAAALEGEGARRYGGRWNPVGIPLVYCSSSLALAVLELLVHVDPRDVPDDLVAIQVELGEAAVRTLAPSDLPADWLDDSGTAALREAGAAWTREDPASSGAVLRVPSVIVPEESNLLLNPRHPGSAGFSIVKQSPFRLDPRLFRS